MDGIFGVMQPFELTMDNFVTAFRYKQMRLLELELWASLLCDKRPPSRMMLEIAVDKRNSFSLNFCQAKLVQPSHLTSN